MLRLLNALLCILFAGQALADATLPRADIPGAKD